MAVDWISYEGRSIGEWRLESFLGDREEKGFYVARSEGSPQPALIKLVMSADGAAGTVRASWKRAKELAHPNILHIQETGDVELDGTRVTYGVFDLPDDDLGEMLTRRTLPAKEARGLFSAVAAGLDYLHRRELRHGAVMASNVFMAEGKVRLGVDNIAPSGVGGKESDMRQFGATMVRAITGRSDALAQLDSPFNEVAAGCVQASADQTWTPARVIQVLSGEPGRIGDPHGSPAAAAPVRAPVRPAAAPMVYTHPVDPPLKRKRSNWPLAAAAAIPAFLIGYWFLGRSSEPQAAARQTAERPRTVARSTPPVVENKPDPTQRTPAPVTPPDGSPRKAVEPPPRRAVEPAPRKAELAPKKTETAQKEAAAQPGSWAVIAAAYSNYGAAANRAEKMRARLPQLQPHVFPAEGKGKLYYVVLGSGLSQEAASELLSVARQHGAPKDAYVTRVADH